MANGITEIVELQLLLKDEQALKNLKLTEAEIQKLKLAVSGIDDEFVEAFQKAKIGLQGLSAPINQALPGTMKLNMAMNQLGYVVNDASMFLVNFRMGMMGIANNIPMVISMFQAARAEIAITGATMKSAMVASIMGPGGLLLAMNGLMLAMQFLPDLLDSIRSSSDELTRSMSDEEKGLRNKRIEFNMLIGVLQDVNKEESLRKEALKELNEKYPEYIKLQESDVTNNEKIASALKKGNEQFELKIKLAASEKILSEYYERVLEAEYDIQKLQEERARIHKQFVGDWVTPGNKSRGFSLVSIDEDIKALETKKIEAMKKVQEFNLVTLSLNSLIDDAPDKSPKKKNKKVLGKPLEGEVLARGLENAFNGIEVPNIELKRMAEEELAKLKIDNITDEFERRRALADWELQNESMKYYNYENFEEIRTELERQHSITRKEIALDEANFKVETTLNTLSMLQSAFAEHTAIAKAAAVASTIIQTYLAATAALAPPPIGAGPLLGPILAGITTVSGMGNVAKIMSTDVKGYAEGGLLPKGKSGYIEGWHNEIIAPEKTFIDVMRTQILPQLYAPSDNNLSGFEKKMDSYISEIRNWQKDFTFIQRGTDLVAVTDKSRNTISELEY